MTYREIMNIANDVVEKYSDQIVDELLLHLIADRKNNITALIESSLEKKELEEWRKKLKALTNAKEREFYLNIKDRLKKQLADKIEDITDNAALYLTNAEYFGFTGQLSK